MLLLMLLQFKWLISAPVRLKSMTLLTSKFQAVYFHETVIPGYRITLTKASHSPHFLPLKTSPSCKSQNNHVLSKRHQNCNVGQTMPFICKGVVAMTGKFRDHLSKKIYQMVFFSAMLTKQPKRFSVKDTPESGIPHLTEIPSEPTPYS